jgi:glycosyltransferase involved in cell wall biosynthesis
MFLCVTSSGPDTRLIMTRVTPQRCTTSRWDIAEQGADVHRRVLIVHPSAELYGSDRVALESARACREAGWKVDVTLAEDGPLVSLLQQAGCHVTVTPAPVLRKSYLTPAGLVRFAGLIAVSTPAMLRLLRHTQPDVAYVSTLTVPWWLVLARLCGTPVLVHVHEAEADVSRPVRFALAAPQLLARRVIANSLASRQTLVSALPRLAGRIDVIYNGVPGPAGTPSPLREELAAPIRLGMVGRVSPRKGTDVAVRALALLHERGLDVTLDLVGGVFPGYEWFEADVRRQVSEAGLTAAVRWLGVLPDVWAALDAVDIVLVPSRVEPFGNAAVEAMLADRPVIAGATQGLREIVRSGENGLLVEPGDAASLADAITQAIADWPRTRERAHGALVEAQQRYSPEQYRKAVEVAVERVRPGGRRDCSR